MPPGANTIKVKVTAEDGIETRTYTVTVTRAVAAATSLSGLRLSDGTLDPAFASSTTHYRADVGNSVETVTVMPTTSDVDATVEYLDASDAAIEDADTVMDGHQVALAVGANTIQVKVTAADGMATQTYTVTVIRAASADASLSGLTLSDGSLDPAFATGTDSYTVDVASNVAAITVAAMTAHSGARVAYLDASDAAIEDVDTVMAGHQAPLGMGDNTIKLKVTAEDAMATRTYTVIVTRTVSTDAGLSDLHLERGHAESGLRIRHDRLRGRGRHQRRDDHGIADDEPHGGFGGVSGRGRRGDRRCRQDRRLASRWRWRWARTRSR